MFRQYRPIEEGEFIVVGVDTAQGVNDYTAGQFLSVTKLDVPLVYHSSSTITEFTPILSKVLEKIYDVTGKNPTVAIERQNGGVFEVERLARMNRLNKYNMYQIKTHGTEYSNETIKLGWDTTSATRPIMLQDLKSCIDTTRLKIYDKQTISELFSFVKVKSSSIYKAQADKHSHDDLVMALAIAWQMFQSEPDPIATDSIGDLLPTNDLFDENGFY